MASSFDWYSVLKDFAGPVATIIASAVAVGVTGYFARQQAKTAIDQLSLNLFEKRYAIYAKIKQFLESVRDLPFSNDLKVVERPSVVLSEAIFFFSSKTCQWLETVEATCNTAYLAKQRTQRDPQAEEELQTLSLKVQEHLKELPKRFRDELSFPGER